MFIISLTTIPPRFDFVSKTLQSLISQFLKPTLIVVNVPRYYRRFGAAPQLQVSHPLVKINWMDVDYGPATKLIGGLDFSEDLIVVVDDDRIYDPQLTYRLVQAAELFTNATVTECGTEVDELLRNAGVPSEAVKGARMQPRVSNTGNGFVDTLQGCCGFITRKTFFSADIKDVPSELFLQDDIYISAYLAKKQIPIWCGTSGRNRTIDPSRHTGDSISSLFDLPGADGRHSVNVRGVEWVRENYHVW